MFTSPSCLTGTTGGRGDCRETIGDVLALPALGITMAPGICPNGPLLGPSGAPPSFNATLAAGGGITDDRA